MRELTYRETERVVKEREDIWRYRCDMCGELVLEVTPKDRNLTVNPMAVLKLADGTEIDLCPKCAKGIADQCEEGV